MRVHRVAGWSRFLARLYANPEKPFHPTLPDPGLVRVLGRILRESRPQIVHAHSWLLYSFLPLLPSRETRLVVAVCDYGFICPKGTLVYRGGVCTGPKYAKCVGCAREQYGALRSLALTSGLTAMKPWRGRVDRYVANSKFTARAMAELIEPGKGPMEVIPPFVSDEAFRADQEGRPAFVPSEGPYLMFAGALGPHKGLNVLLEAWAGLEPKIPLVLAGIRRPDTPRSFPVGVILAEEVANEDVLRAFGHCLAAVVPSVWPEPFGTVVVEAMAVGRPVIARLWAGWQIWLWTAPRVSWCRRETLQLCGPRCKDWSQTLSCAPGWEVRVARGRRPTLQTWSWRRGSGSSVRFLQVRQRPQVRRS